MNSFLLYGKQDIRYSDLPYPNPEPNEVIVKIKSVGICGSDIHYYLDGKIGGFIPKAPFALGHELSGEIVQESLLHPRLKKGTRVSVNPSQPCYKCVYCQKKSFNLCLSMKYIGSASVFPHQNGGFAEFLKIPEENCYELPDYVSYDEAALLEPLAVGLHAVLKVRNLAGKSVLITGAGPIGQLTQIVCKYYGAKTIITDINSSKLELAKKIGADSTLNPRDSDFFDQVQNIKGEGFDVLFEASGALGILQNTVGYLKKGSSVIQLGMCNEGDQFPFADFMKNELSFQSSFRFSSEYELAFELLTKRKLDLNQIITARFPFEKIPEAIKKASESLKDVKIIIQH